MVVDGVLLDVRRPLRVVLAAVSLRRPRSPSRSLRRVIGRSSSATEMRVRTGASIHCLRAVSRLAHPSTLYPEDAQQSVVTIRTCSAIFHINPP